MDNIQARKNVVRVISESVAGSWDYSFKKHPDVFMVGPCETMEEYIMRNVGAFEAEVEYSGK